MAFPVVASVNVMAAMGSSNTTTPVTFDAASNGDRVVSFIASDAAALAHTWPSPWVVLKDEAITGAWASIAYLDCTGGETGVNVTHVSEKSNAISIRYAAGSFDPAVAPEITTAATGSSLNPDPDSLTPSWGALDTGWIAVALVDQSDPTEAVTAYPSGYTDNQTESHLSSSAGSLGLATKNLNATSDNPGTFTLNITETWNAYTLGIKPAAAAPAVGDQGDILWLEDSDVDNDFGVQLEDGTGVVLLQNTMHVDGVLIGGEALAADENQEAVTGVVVSNPFTMVVWVQWTDSAVSIQSVITGNGEVPMIPVLTRLSSAIPNVAIYYAHLESIQEDVVVDVLFSGITDSYVGGLWGRGFGLADVSTSALDLAPTSILFDSGLTATTAVLEELLVKLMVADTTHASEFDDEEFSDLTRMANGDGGDAYGSSGYRITADGPSTYKSSGFGIFSGKPWISAIAAFRPGGYVTADALITKLVSGSFTADAIKKRTYTFGPGGTAYATEVLADSPIAYWRLGEPSGTNADDAASGSLHDGTYVGSPTLGVSGALTGDGDTAVTFNAVTQRMTAPDHAALDLGNGPVTLEAWVKLTTTAGSGFQFIIDKGNNAYALGYYPNSGSVPNTFFFSKAGSARICRTSVTVTDTAWHHVVATKTGATSKIYLDGADVTTFDGDQTLVDTSSVLTVAGSQNLLTFSVDEPAVYGSALSAARILAHYTAGTTGTSDGAGITVDAVVSSGGGTVSGSFTANAVIRKTINGSFVADAVLKKTISGSGTADAVLKRTQTGTFVADAVLKKTQSSSATANAVIKRTQTGSFTGDAVLKKTISGSGTADAVLKKTISSSFTANAVLRKTQSGSFVADADLKKTISSSFVADSVLKRNQTGSFTANAVIRKTTSGSFAADAVIRKTQFASITADAIQKRTMVFGPNSDYAALVLADSPTNYWRLGEASGAAADDLMSAVNGIYIGSPTLGVAGAINGDPDTAITLASGKYVTVTPSMGTVGTFECWAKRTRVGFNEVLLGSPTNGVIVRFTSTDDAIWLGKENVGWIKKSSISITDTSWHHIAASWDGAGSGSIYIDGVDVTQNLGSFSPSAQSTTNLGTNDGDVGGIGFIGSMDEVALYSSQLSAGRVLAHYNAGVSRYAALILADSPVGYWRLGETSGTTAFDAIGAHNGAYQNTPTLGVDGAIYSSTDKAARFDAPSFERVFLSNPVLTATDNWTIEAWVKASAWATDMSVVGVGAASGYSLWIDNGEPRGLGSPGSGMTDGSGTPLSVNVWHHVILRRSGGVNSVWVDGAQYDPGTNNTFGGTAPATSTEIASWDGLFFTLGSIDEVALYATPLSSAQIAEHYNAGVSSGPGISIDAFISRTVTGSFTADAVLKKTQSASFTADAVLRKTTTVTFTANAVLFKTIAGSFTTDAVLKRTQTGTYTADAIVRVGRTGSATADAVLRVSRTGSLTADAALKKTISGSATADAVLKKTISGSFLADAVLKKTASGSFLADAVIRRTQSASFTADADLKKTISGSYAADAVLRVGRTGSFTADAVTRITRSASITADAVIKKTTTVTFTADAVLFKAISGSFAGDAVVRRTTSATFDADAVIKKTTTATPTADAVIFKTVTGSFTANAVIMPVFSIDAILKRIQTSSFTANAVIMPRFTADAVLKATISGSFGAFAFIAGVGVAAYSADAVILRTGTGSFTVDAVLRATGSATLSASAVIRVTESASFAADSIIRKTISGSITADAVIQTPRTVGVTADAVILSLRTSAFAADAIIKRVGSATLTADAVVKATSSASYAADAVVRRAAAGSYTADAVLTSAGGARTFTANAVVRAVGSVSYAADAIVRRSATGSFTADATIKRVGSASATANAVIFRTQLGSFAANAVIRVLAQTASFTADAYITASRVGSFTANAVSLRTQTSSFDARAVLRAESDHTLTAAAVLRRSSSITFTSDAILRRAGSGSFSANAFLRFTGGSLTADAVIRGQTQFFFSIDAVITVERRRRISATLLTRFSAATIQTQFTAATIATQPLFTSTLTVDMIAASIRRGAFSGQLDVWFGSFTASAVIV